MKVAISTDNGNVSAHFGRCPQFTIITIEKGKINKREIIDNPGHHPGFLPDFLSKQGVGTIVAGGMGGRAKELFESAGIDMIIGVEGQISELESQIANGTLKSTGSICQPGAGKGYGINKSECDHKDHEKEE